MKPLISEQKFDDKQIVLKNFENDLDSQVYINDFVVIIKTKYKMNLDENFYPSFEFFYNMHDYIHFTVDATENDTYIKRYMDNLKNLFCNYKDITNIITTQYIRFFGI